MPGVAFYLGRGQGMCRASELRERGLRRRRRRPSSPDAGAEWGASRGVGMAIAASNTCSQSKKLRFSSKSSRLWSFGNVPAGPRFSDPRQRPKARLRRPRLRPGGALGAERSTFFSRVGSCAAMLLFEEQPLSRRPAEIWPGRPGAQPCAAERLRKKSFCC